ncbi:glyoxalase [Pseudoalteromonas sp. A25]|uniref:VOC family protein n=1 Tax=Pseudoalteromonas sp. A25 TaxID=116092 RepID=UPI001260EAA4|nr:VOC family protein [Pseudoalteromonas sp. A25]BBN83803.1 glyoxalase [Pseudoalteromonas sp. A25]
MQDHINYVEFAANDLAATERFFSDVFSWQFEHYGPDYIAFNNSGIDGGFYRSEQVSVSANGGALVVLYSNMLEQTLEKVQQAGGTISKDIFSFPGGRRFHFIEPSGNELAVWTAC